MKIGKVSQTVLKRSILKPLQFHREESLIDPSVEEMCYGIKVEAEEEVSVESLLYSTPEVVLDNIEVETKSETRKLIEKFVDENPEAAANLLRNWLNEDWGM